MSIALALQYLLDRKYPISPEDMKTIGTSIKAVSGEYNPVRQELWAAVYDAVWGFLSSKASITTYREPMATAVAKAYIATADIAYVDGGGSLPLDEDTLAYARSEMNSQLAYVDSLFETLKQLRKEGDFDAISMSFQKSNLWTNSLDSFYNTIKTMGAKNKMLTFTGDDGKESCNDCKRYKNQRHRASWWASHGAVPPNRDFECHGYNCHHILVDDDGNQFTV